MDNEFRLTIEFVFGDNGNNNVTLSADTPHGPYKRVVFTKNVDGQSAIEKVITAVEEGARVKPGPRPKYRPHCQWVVQQLRAFGKSEQAIQSPKPVMPAMVSSLLH